jgi:WhiB family transcriptional regulator, redox-sensing transcriptional regulator
MTVLFSELQIAGWAENGSKIGLDDVAYRYDDDRAFTLPCHSSDPEIFFADSDLEIAVAKSLCASCPMKSACLEGAISRAEPCGVWGGELIEDGAVIARKRRPGRPSRQEIAA